MTGVDGMHLDLGNVEAISISELAEDFRWNQFDDNVVLAGIKMPLTGYDWVGNDESKALVCSDRFVDRN